jgi:putative sugar O-methyltransferase
MSKIDQYAALQQAFTTMQQQDALYQPSAFWASASKQIAQAVQQQGVENFRAIPEILAYFVPTYGSPGNSFTAEMQQAISQFFQSAYPDAIKAQITIQQWLNGYQAALADYRVLIAAAAKSTSLSLQRFSESDYGNPVEQFEFDGKKFSRSSLNYLLGLSLLQQYIDEEIQTVLEIGGGFGTLGEILAKCSTNNVRYIDIDIPPTSFVAENYLRAALPEQQVAGFQETEDLAQIEIEQLPAISVLSSWQLPKVSGNVDLFVNFISFQEMEPHIVQNYLQHVERLNTKWILLRNIKEGKQIKKHKDDIGVEQPILGDDYIAMLPNYQLITRQVHPFGFKTVDNFHSELFLFKRK